MMTLHEQPAPIPRDADTPNEADASSSRDQAASGFAGLELNPQVHDAVLRSGYLEPTSVQQRVIPHVLAGRDVIAQSQTGSGKTAAFALPILSMLQAGHQGVHTLVLAPTRELALQVGESFEKYAEQLSRFRLATIYGGQDYQQQFRALKRGVDVVVGTPGRVIDHIKRGTLDLSDLQCLVLDEADEMLNMGFIEDVQFVLEQTPPGRQVTLFSATMAAPVRKIAETYLVDPATVTIEKKQLTAESIRQRAVLIQGKAKAGTLMRFLETEDTDGVIVFTKTKDTTVRLAEQLIRNGFSATALNGDMPQQVRERAVEQLKSGRLDILVATDVAARGLDVSRISHVFNFDLPHDSESYIHRIGRTGRAGRSGEAIIFLTPAQRRKLRLIEKATKKSIEWVDVPSADQVNAKRIEHFKQKLTRTLADRDVALFEQLLEQYSRETDTPPLRVAAALADLAHHGRPFLVTDRPQPNEFSEKNSRSKDERPRKHGSDSGKKPRKLGPPEPGMIRYRIEVGREHGVAPRNIVGAVANEAGIESEFIGPIKIYPHFSTVDLPEGMPKDIYQTLQRTWVAGKQLRIRPDRGPGGRAERRGRPTPHKTRKKRKGSTGKSG
jgi:ATP-dependent RNA helicase DeaD